jgi:hypothetical protein
MSYHHLYKFIIIGDTGASSLCWALPVAEHPESLRSRPSRRHLIVRGRNLPHLPQFLCS